MSPLLFALLVTLTHSLKLKTIDWCYQTVKTVGIHDEHSLNNEDCPKLDHHYRNFKSIIDAPLEILAMRLDGDMVKARLVQTYIDQKKEELENKGIHIESDSSDNSQNGHGSSTHTVKPVKKSQNQPQSIKSSKKEDASQAAGSGQGFRPKGQYVYDPENWMGQFVNQQGDWKISLINIPGTHETLSIKGPNDKWYKGGFILKKQRTEATICQVGTIIQQLNMGFRWFDIRLKEESAKLMAYHGHCPQDISFTEISDHVYNWLQNHPQECIIMKIKNEKKDKHKEFADAFNNFLTEFGKKHPGMFRTDNTVPTLKECKGQVLIVADGDWNDLLPKPFKILIDRKDEENGHKSSSVKNRKDTFISQMERTKRARNTKSDKELYRSNLNSNALSLVKEQIGIKDAIFHHGLLQKADNANKGTPKNFAKALNYEAAEYIFHKAFSTLSDEIRCNGEYMGVIVIDIPAPELIKSAEIIASFVINSNCPRAKLSKSQQNELSAQFNALEVILKAKEAHMVRYDDMYYAANNAYDDQDSYEESDENGQDLYGYTDITHHQHRDQGLRVRHEIGTDYDYGYDQMRQGRFYHDTISDGYYHEYGEYDYFHNNSDNLAIFAMGIIVFICICCPLLIISVICGIAAGKVYLITNRDKSQSKHPCDQVIGDSEDQV